MPQRSQTFVNVPRHCKRCQETGEKKKEVQSYNCLLRNQQQKKRKKRKKNPNTTDACWLKETRVIHSCGHLPPALWQSFSFAWFLPPTDNWVAGHWWCLSKDSAACMWAEKFYSKASNDVYIQGEKIITWNIALAKMKVFLVNLSCHLPKLTLACLLL